VIQAQPDLKAPQVRKGQLALKVIPELPVLKGQLV
jgi:hypothetical protein